MDVVEDAVGVEDPVGLTDHDPLRVRLVLTAILIEDTGVLGAGQVFPAGSPFET